MIIRNFATKGVPKAVYDDEGKRTDKLSGAFSFAVFDKDKKRIGSFSLGQPEISDCLVDVIPQTFKNEKGEDVPYFTYLRGFATEAEADRYLALMDKAPEIKEKMEKLDEELDI
jgi:hypothetical protein